MFNCCSHGTLLHFCLQSSHLNICYHQQDLHLRRLHPGLRLRLQGLPKQLSYSSWRSVCGDAIGGGVTSFRSSHPSRASPTACDGQVWARCSSTIHFQGYSIWQVSCYTLLSGFRLPWPLSCCLYQPTPFLGSDEHQHRVP